MAMRWLLVVTKAEKERVSNLPFRYEEGENGIKKTALRYVKRGKTKKTCELVSVLRTWGQKSVPSGHFANNHTL
jgi:hypothetical protein